MLRSEIAFGIIFKIKNCFPCYVLKVSEGAKIRNRYNQVPHLTQDTNGKVTNPQTPQTREQVTQGTKYTDAHNGHSKHKTEKV